MYFTCLNSFPEIYVHIAYLGSPWVKTNFISIFIFVEK